MIKGRTAQTGFPNPGVYLYTPYSSVKSIIALRFSGFTSSIEFSKYLLEEKNIVATPGVGFGKYGEGFIRFALTVDKTVLKKTYKLLNG